MSFEYVASLPQIKSSVEKPHSSLTILHEVDILELAQKTGRAAWISAV